MNRAPGPSIKRTPASVPSDSPVEILHLESVEKSFGSTQVLDRVELRLCAGEGLAILGRSGTGKSVLLRVINGLIEPDEGEVYLWGEPTRRLAEREWARLRRRTGMVFQSGALFDSMTVFDNIAFPIRQRQGHTEDEIQELVHERLEWVELPGIGPKMPSELSGGMRRRVALARTLIHGPEFILYDEPTTGLDPLTSKKISILMRDLGQRLGTTSILVTHDLQCARIVSSRWAYLSRGSILQEGAPDELVSSDHSEIREFLSTNESLDS